MKVEKNVLLMALEKMQKTIKNVEAISPKSFLCAKFLQIKSFQLI